MEPTNLVNQPQPVSSLDVNPQTRANEIAKLDVRPVQLLTEYRAAPETITAMCGAAGFDSVSTFAHLADY